jgi:guanylate kinase
MSSSHKIIIITAPSGAGKTSITKHLLKTFPGKLAFFYFCRYKGKKEVMKKRVLIIIL